MVIHEQEVVTHRCESNYSVMDLVISCGGNGDSWTGMWRLIDADVVTH